MTFTIFALPSLAALAANVAIGAYVLRRKRFNILSRYFALWSASLAIWSLGEAGAIVSATSGDAPAALSWAKLMYLGVFLAAPAYASFASGLIGKKPATTVLYPLFLLFLLTLLAGYSISGITLTGLGYRLAYGIAFAPLAAAASLMVAYALYLLWKESKKVEHPPAKKKLRLVLYSVIAPLLLAAMADAALYALGINLYLAGSIFTAFIAAGTAYAFLSRG